MTGVDENKNSYAKEWVDVSFQERVISSLNLFEGEPSAKPRAGGVGNHVDLGISVGQIRWMNSHFPPNSEVANYHHTDTVDLQVVITGSIYLVLADGAHLLETGDGAVIYGVDHSWRAGEAGCLLSSVLVGTPPPTT